MKKIIIAVTLSLLLGFSGVALAADGDISQTEVRADVEKWVIDTVKLMAISKTAIVTYRKVDASGNPIGEIRAVFKNVIDDPVTPEDETDNSFSQLITLINNNDNIKASITQAVKIKLGIN